MCVATAFGIIGVTAALAGLELIGSLMGIVGGFVSGVCYYRLPGVVFDDDVAPKAIVIQEHEDGLTDEERARRLAIHSERGNLKEEKIEKERKKQRAKAAGNRRTF